MAKYWLEIKIENNSWWEGQSIGTSRTCECQHWQSTSLVSVWNCGVWWYLWHNLAVLTGDHHCMGNVITSQDLNGLTVLFYPTTAGERWMCACVCVLARLRVMVWPDMESVCVVTWRRKWFWLAATRCSVAGQWRECGEMITASSYPATYLHKHRRGEAANLIKPGQICFVDPWNMEWNGCWWWFNI